jgi:hypothetical protein
MKPSALLLLLPALALAAPAQQRAAALLVAGDAQAEALLPRMEAQLARALGHFEALQVRSPESLHGLAVDPAAPAALERAKRAYAAALAAYAQGRAGPALEQVRASLQEARGAVAAMRGCTPLCDATALHAALLLERGEVEEAKRALLDLMALEPTYALSAKHFRRELLALRAQVGTSRAAALRGSASVLSEPGGARVLLDGEPLGYTPVGIPALAVGAHLLQLERPGFRSEGRILQASEEEQLLTVPLTPLPGYAAARAQAQEAVRALAKEGASPAAVALGQRLGLERALLGSLRTRAAGEEAELTLALYELKGGQLLASRRVTLQREELGQLGAELERLVNQVMASAASGATARAHRSGDPLENTQGTEEWSSEDRGGRSRQAEQKRKAEDPLDAVSGTEDW